MKPKILAQPAGSEIEQFARFFHQDFRLMFGSVSEGGTEYIRSLSAERKQVLAISLRKVLSEHLGQSQRGLLNTWQRMGAEYWNRKNDLRSCLSAWAAELEDRTK